MVAAVGDRGVEDGQGVPEPGHGQVGTHEQGTRSEWAQVDNVMLQRVTGDGGDSDGSRPLVVDLVDVLVNTGMVE